MTTGTRCPREDIPVAGFAMINRRPQVPLRPPNAGRAPAEVQKRGDPEMLTAEAHIQTSRPSRYLIQLCKHARYMGQHGRHGLRAHPGNNTPERPQMQHAEWSDTFGILRLNWGECTIQANPDTLTLRAQAADEENLRRIQELIAGRLEKFGRRDHLKVTWQPLRRAAIGRVTPAGQVTVPARSSAVKSSRVTPSQPR